MHIRYYVSMRVIEYMDECIYIFIYVYVYVSL